MGKLISIRHEHFKPEISDVLSDSSKSEIERISSSLEFGTEEFLGAGGGNSSTLQTFLKTSMNAIGYGAKTPFVFFDDRAPANFEVDFFKQSNDIGTLTHVAGEFAFDNRQAIGTNVLKVDLCLNNLAFRSLGEVQMGALVTFCRDSRELASWDPGVGDFEDYVEFLKKGFGKYLTFPMHVFGIQRN